VSARTLSGEIHDSGELAHELTRTLKNTGNKLGFWCYNRDSFSHEPVYCVL